MINYPRSLEAALRSADSAGKVRLLFGARRTGKSTLLRRLADPDAVTFNLQERRVRLELERDPHVFTQTLDADTRRKKMVCVDEIQKVPALLDEVQYLYDKHPGQYEFFLTGRSARKLKTSALNLLPGILSCFWRLIRIRPGAAISYVVVASPVA